jgi:hypothetical protein
VPGSRSRLATSASPACSSGRVPDPRPRQ